MNNPTRDRFVYIALFAALAADAYQGYIIHHQYAVIKGQSALIADYQESLSDAVIALKAADWALKSANAVPKDGTPNLPMNCVWDLQLNDCVRVR